MLILFCFVFLRDEIQKVNYDCVGGYCIYYYVVRVKTSKMHTLLRVILNVILMSYLKCNINNIGGMIHFCFRIYKTAYKTYS